MGLSALLYHVLTYITKKITQRFNQAVLEIMAMHVDQEKFSNHAIKISVYFSFHSAFQITVIHTGKYLKVYFDRLIIYSLTAVDRGKEVLGKRPTIKNKSLFT